MSQLEAARRCRGYFMTRLAHCKCPARQSVLLERCKEVEKLISQLHKKNKE